MKKLALAILTFGISTGAIAQQFAVNINFPGGLAVVNGHYNGGTLDFVSTQRYFAVNGSLKTSIGLDSPATGTCFSTALGGIYCNLQVDHLSVNMEIQPNLAGTATIKSAAGDVISASSVVITSVN